MARHDAHVEDDIASSCQWKTSPTRVGTEPSYKALRLGVSWNFTREVEGKSQVGSRLGAIGPLSSVEFEWK